jgi:histone H3/H4
MNHKSSWAEENRAPKYQEPITSEPIQGRRILVQSNSSKSEVDEEVLIVASKLKQYIKDKHDMNTSANVMEILSKIVRRYADLAADHARSEGRKTVMDRDFK